MEIFDGEARSIDIGGRISVLRVEKKKSIRRLANESGISANALSNIERNQTTPNVSTLYKIANALEIPITNLFKDELEGRNIIFQKGVERTRLSFPRGLWEGLGGELFSGDLDPFILTLESGGNSGPHSVEHTGDEFVFCLRGAVEYLVGNEIFHLEAGDSLLFGANNPHRWRNVGNTVANVLIVLSGYIDTEHPGKTHVAR